VRDPRAPCASDAALGEVISGSASVLAAKVGAFRAKHRLPGAVAGVATRDGLRWWHGSGFADLETGRRPDERTLYRIASISKTFTATAVLQLRDEGRLRLDDPVVRYIGELAAATDRHGPIEDVTIRRLLMHTSGLQGEPPWQDSDRIWMYRPSELLEVLSLVSVATPPEVDHKYSNLGFELLGIVVERVAGRPFIEHVRASILEPLGMRDTVWFPDADQVARQAVGYDARVHDDRPGRARDFDSALAEAAGGLWSTLDDLGRWLGQQLRAGDGLERRDGQVLDGRTLSEMHRPSFVVEPDWTWAQGLCWYGTRSGETILIGHLGGTWGFTTSVSFSPTGRVGAVVLLNGIGPASELARQLIEALLPAIAEADDRAPVDAPAAPIPDAWRELLGVYRDPEFASDLMVEWRYGRLVLTDDRPDAPVHDLEPTDDPLVFKIRGGRPGGEPIAFVRGPDGRVDRCNASGYPAIRVDMVRPPAPR
jgi:D-alanyl-D-alanine carboxypeptidase